MALTFWSQIRESFPVAQPLNGKEVPFIRAVWAFATTLLQLLIWLFFTIAELQARAHQRFHTLHLFEHIVTFRNELALPVV